MNIWRKDLPHLSISLITKYSVYQPGNQSTSQPTSQGTSLPARQPANQSTSLLARHPVYQPGNQSTRQAICIPAYHWMANQHWLEHFIGHLLNYWIFILYWTLLYWNIHHDRQVCLFILTIELYYCCL